MGRTKNQVQKPAKVHQLKSGSWAVLVTLVQPRRLEGKMRSGRQKFERQTEPLANALCAEINALLFDKELARQLSKREVEIAKKVFWEILEPKHPEWIDHLTDIISHAEKTGFRPPNNTVPTIAEAARIFYREHMRKNLEKETLRSYRKAVAFLLPKFGHLKAYEMTDQQIVELAYGTEPLKYMRSTNKWRAPEDELEANTWATLDESKAQRPWTFQVLKHFLQCARVFKNWMHESKDPLTQTKRNWCPPSTLELPTEPKPHRTANRDAAGRIENVCDPECAKNPALTIPQAQAVIDVAWVVCRGRYAPFYVHALWCGSRSKEISRTDVTAFNSHDGILAIPEIAAKTDQGRESEVYPNAIIMVEALRSAGLYTNKGLRPHALLRTVIHLLAGFTSNNKQALTLAERERKRLETRGIFLPRYNWGVPFPRNALRRTALSMHYKLFLNVPFTTGWAGNSPGIFKEFYKRLVTKQQAREYWVMLPTWLTKKRAIEVELPKGHKLDSALTNTVNAAVSAACEAMSKFSDDFADAVRVEGRTDELANANLQSGDEDIEDAALVPAI